MGRKHTVSVSLDALLDTRIGAVARYNETIASQLLTTNQYHSRRHNQLQLILPYVDNNAIEASYQQRDKEVLKLSPATPILATLSNLVTDYRVHKEIVPEKTTVTIVLNTWPYRLTEEETSEFVLSIKEATGADVVKATHRSPDRLVPDYISQFDTFIWHELDEWAGIHLANLETKVMAKTTFYCPEIITTGLEQLESIPKEGPGKELRALLSEYILFEVMPLSMFSLYPKEA